MIYVVIGLFVVFVGLGYWAYKDLRDRINNIATVVKLICDLADENNETTKKAFRKTQNDIHMMDEKINSQAEKYDELINKLNSKTKK